MNFSRNQLRKLSWLRDIHEWMKAANEAGSITRQEAVSMVPPMFMDVQPHHRVREDPGLLKAQNEKKIIM
jgi:16S rRNA C967 or C1407 C5-methylase (RsmB/RsmF family)